MSIHEIVNGAAQHKADLELLATMGTIFSATVTMFFAYITIRLTWIMLRFTIKPKVRIRLIENHHFISSKTYIMTFEVKNVGYRFYGKPPATGITAWVNVQEAFYPIKVRHGSNLEIENLEVRRGKENSKYFKVENINLFYEEPPELIELTAKMPKKKGKYLLWISLSSVQGGYTVFRKRIKVCQKKECRHGLRVTCKSLELD